MITASQYEMLFYYIKKDRRGIGGPRLALLLAEHFQDIFIIKRIKHYGKKKEK